VTCTGENCSLITIAALLAHGQLPGHEAVVRGTAAVVRRWT
jgi:hypothetical protein